MGSLVHDDAGFELQLPSDAAAGDDATTAEPKKHTARPAAKRTAGGATLPVLLATAAKIAALLHRLEDPDLAGRFRASYNGTVIGWRDFYHDLIVEDSRETLTRFYDNLAGEHPMAVAGVIHRIAQARNGQPFIDLHIERPAQNPERTAWIHVRIISYNLDFHDYQVGDAILAYGMW